MKLVLQMDWFGGYSFMRLDNLAENMCGKQEDSSKVMKKLPYTLAVHHVYARWEMAQIEKKWYHSYPFKVGRCMCIQ